MAMKQHVTFEEIKLDNWNFKGDRNTILSQITVKLNIGKLIEYIDARKTVSIDNLDGEWEIIEVVDQWILDLSREKELVDALWKACDALLTAQLQKLINNHIVSKIEKIDGDYVLSQITGGKSTVISRGPKPISVLWNTCEQLVISEISKDEPQN